MHIYLQIMKDIFCYEFSVDMLFNKDFFKGAYAAIRLSKLLSAIISSIFVWFAPSQRRFGDFKHQVIDWTLFEREIYNILRYIVPSEFSHMF